VKIGSFNISYCIFSDLINCSLRRSCRLFFLPSAFLRLDFFSACASSYVSPNLGEHALKHSVHVSCRSIYFNSQRLFGQPNRISVSARLWKVSKLNTTQGNSTTKTLKISDETHRKLTQIVGILTTKTGKQARIMETPKS